MKRVRRDVCKQIEVSSNNADQNNLDETELLISKKVYDTPFIEKKIKEGDTLQSLSIKYDCPIAELKRLNNIHKDNEIYARNTIKVPNRAFVVLAGVHHSGNSSPGNLSEKDLDESLLNDKLIKLQSQQKADLNRVIFNCNIKTCDNEGIDSLQIESSESSSDNEEVQLLGKDNVNGRESVNNSKLSCSGADADISWIALIVCIVILIFAVPLIYVYYIAEHPDEYHHPAIHERPKSSS